MVATTPYNVPRDPLMGANHLTAVRWILAGLVALGHAFLLTTAYEPIRIHEWTGGYMAVNGFFVLSGLLIAKSLDLRRDLKLYAASRAFRIYPALIVLMLSRPEKAGYISSAFSYLAILKMRRAGSFQVILSRTLTARFGQSVLKSRPIF